MSPSAVIDTHAAIWYLNADPRLTARAKTFIDNAGVQGQPVLVATITLVEVVYLQEKGRIPHGTLTRVADALHDPASVLQIADLSLAIALALGRVLRDEVPDMPDRIIAATAVHFGVPVISRDGKIRTSSVSTIW